METPGRHRTKHIGLRHRLPRHIGRHLSRHPADAHRLHHAETIQTRRPVRNHHSQNHQHHNRDSRPRTTKSPSHPPEANTPIVLATIRPSRATIPIQIPRAGSSVQGSTRRQLREVESILVVCGGSRLVRSRAWPKALGVTSLSKSQLSELALGRAVPPDTLIGPIFRPQDERRLPGAVSKPQDRMSLIRSTRVRSSMGEGSNPQRL